MAKPITRTEFILRHIRANNQGEFDRQKAELLFDWLVDEGFIEKKEES